ncbi:MAG: CDP-alcohol phosphatidyltransferase family protein [Oscillospiraceae bacterium]|nr:CDP-alcohol phosphatidyltransferase family protein [Oscillospiraceae bacterium]MBR5722718.1 CDP-alcohol phosphatidyltransferase family protein [Oscillospiraceae bacterium]
MAKSTYQNPVKKMIPSKLETGFQQFLYQHVGKHIPKSMTPNDMTLVGALGGLAAVIFTLLTNLSPWFFLGTIAGVAVHLIADDLDGYIARNRGMSSRAGAYFDLITDVLFSTFLLLAMGLTPYCSMKLAAFAAPLYGVTNVTIMNYIIYFNEFQFPRLGPIEAHLSYAAVCILGLIFRTKEIVTIGSVGFTVMDLIMLIGMIPMYYEMIRLQIRLFRRLKETDRSE